MLELQEMGPPLAFIILIFVIAVLVVRGRILQGEVARLKKQRQELISRRDLQEKMVAEQRVKSEGLVEKEKIRTSEVRSELERQKEIARIAASISNEQSKKLMFFTDIAQEFRSPLTLIMGSLDSVLGGEYGRLPNKLRTQLEMILRSSRQLVRFMDQFHDISKLQTGQMELKISRNNLTKFLKDIIATLSWYAEKKKIKLDFQSSGREIEMAFDAQKLSEVVYHLLSNSFRFTPEGGRILVSLSEAPGQDENEEETIELKVRNSGEVIPEEEIPHLFDILRRQSDKERPRMGLSLVKELVSLHGGSIRVRSERQIGTEFAITLPVGKAHLANLEAAGESDREIAYDFSERAKMEISNLELDSGSKNSSSKSQKKLTNVASESRRILIVEDNHDVRELLKGGFKDQLYTITEASNGREALEKAKQLMPDLIISDIMMPEMNGIDLCRNLKADETLNRIPIILLTGKPSEFGKLEGMEAGADEYVSKPFSFAELFAKIENLTRQPGNRSDAKPQS